MEFRCEECNWKASSCICFEPKKEKKMFEGARLGDTVWDFILGEGTITFIDTSLEYPLHINFKSSSGVFNLKGRRIDFNKKKKPTLFWAEIKFEVPKRPKRDLKRPVNLYPSFSGGSYKFSFYTGGGRFTTRGQAEGSGKEDRSEIKTVEIFVLGSWVCLLL